MTSLVQSQMGQRHAILLLSFALIVELPIRYFVFPDPWIHKGDHWYFWQPLRLGIEIGLFLGIFLVGWFLKVPFSVLGIRRLDKKAWQYLGFGVPIALILFSLLEVAQLKSLLPKNILSTMPVWFATGFL